VADVSTGGAPDAVASGEADGAVARQAMQAAWGSPSRLRHTVPRADQPLDDAVGRLRIAGRPVPLAHSSQPSLTELLDGEPGISLQALTDCLDQLAAQIVGQSGLLHLMRHFLDLLCPPTEGGLCANPQLALQGGVEVSIRTAVLMARARP